ncbi:DUF4384 domain-containing protein [uncultured Nitrospira sp.]|uniref:DUF4384 domain-containing protein n=1 Tax=uncultured Nitrospira sp. TaxID=157176 RepID=UPI003140C814
MKTQTRSTIATILISVLLASCSTPQGQGDLSQSHPCQTGGAQSAESPMASFTKQAILNPLANIGGTLLATAAANYSQQYTGKLNTLLTKLVTPKKKKKKQSDQYYGDPGLQQGQQIDPYTGLPVQIDPYTGLPIQTDPNTGLPLQVDPNTGLPIGNQQGFDPGQFPGDPNSGYGGAQPFNDGTPQYGFDANYPNVQGRGVPGQLPHARFPSTPCDQELNPQADQTSYSQNQPYGYDPNGTQQAYPQDPNAQSYPQEDPYTQPTYPPDSYMQTGAETGIQTQEAETPIGLDVVMVKKAIRNGAPVVLPIQDGDILRDGRGNAAAGDKFRIMFRPNHDGHVYVIAIDGSGWAQGIFPPPTSPLANPVKAGEQYVLPEGNNWFSLDQYKGIETIFFVVSQDKRQDIEEILQSITGRERPANENAQQVTRVAMVPYGVGGTQPSAKPFGFSEGSGPDHTIIPTSYLAQQAGQDLRLTRWFRHQ